MAETLFLVYLCTNVLLKLGDKNKKLTFMFLRHPSVTTMRIEISSVNKFNSCFLHVTNYFIIGVKVTPLALRFDN